MIETIKRYIQLLFGRGSVTRIDDSKDCQEIQISILTGESRDRIERIQDYGLTSNPPVKGSEHFTAFINGNRDHGICLKIANRQFRLKNLKEGEVALYTDEGDKIHFKRGNKIDIETKELTINANSKVTINTENAKLNCSNAEVNAELTTVNGNTEINGNLTVTGPVNCATLAAQGSVADSKGTMDQVRETYNGHTHINGPTPDQPMN